MWSWQSISPGSTVMPAQFTISASGGKSAAFLVVISLILLSLMTIVALVTGATPVPSISRAFLRTFIACLRTPSAAAKGDAAMKSPVRIWLTRRTVAAALIISLAALGSLVGPAFAAAPDQTPPLAAGQ